MAYKIDNAIVKKDVMGNLTLIDPEGNFEGTDAFMAIKADDLITIQLLINAILRNDFKNWREIENYSDFEPIKALFVRLGYSKEQMAEMLKEF